MTLSSCRCTLRSRARPIDAPFALVEAQWRRYLREDLPRVRTLDELPDEGPFGERPRRPNTRSTSFVTGLRAWRSSKATCSCASSFAYWARRSSSSSAATRAICATAGRKLKRRDIYYCSHADCRKRVMADAELCTRHGDLRRTERRQINAPRPGKAIVAEAGEYGATQGPVFLSGTLGEPPASVPSIRRCQLDGEAPV